MKKITLWLSVVTKVIVLGLVYYYFNGVVTEGYFTIEEHNILEENGEYYLFLEEKRIEVSKELFNQVEINSRYHIRYSWNRLSNNNGKIEELNIDS